LRRWRRWLVAGSRRRLRNGHLSDGISRLGVTVATRVGRTIGIAVGRAEPIAIPVRSGLPLWDDGGL